MRQTFGEAAALSAGTSAMVDDTSGTSLVTPFRAAMRCAKFLLTVVVAGTGTVTAGLQGYTARNSGKWGLHRVAGLDGATLAVGSYHFVVENFGGYARAGLVHAVASGVPTVTAYLTEIVEGPTSVGD